MSEKDIDDHSPRDSGFRMHNKQHQSLLGGRCALSPTPLLYSSTAVMQRAWECGPVRLLGALKYTSSMGTTRVQYTSNTPRVVLVVDSEYITIRSSSIVDSTRA